MRNRNIFKSNLPLLFQITEWLKDADLNNDGKLSYVEFRHNIQMRQLEQVVVEG